MSKKGDANTLLSKRRQDIESGLEGNACYLHEAQRLGGTYEAAPIFRLTFVLLVVVIINDNDRRMWS